MQRDYSPTYWFRIRRAEQLLALYRRDPAEFARLATEFKSDFVAAGRAPHRLSVWLKKDDLVFRSDDDIRADLGRKLVKALNRPDYFGYALKLPEDQDFLSEASSCGHRRRWSTSPMKRAASTRRWAPRERSTRWKFLRWWNPRITRDRKGKPEALAHSSGQVFDIDHSALPPAELECLRFVLSDLGWAGYLGFVEDGMNSLHIGCSPGAREFFTSVFEEATGKSSADGGPHFFR